MAKVRPFRVVQLFRLKDHLETACSNNHDLTTSYLLCVRHVCICQLLDSIQSFLHISSTSEHAPFQRVNDILLECGYTHLCLLCVTVHAAKTFTQGWNMNAIFELCLHSIQFPYHLLVFCACHFIANAFDLLTAISDWFMTAYFTLLRVAYM